MNSLSLLIFAIGVIENIAGFSTWILVVSWIVFIIGMLAIGMTHLTAIISKNESYPKEVTGISEFVSAIGKYVKYSFATILIFTLLNFFMIDKKYMILIAASEVGEMVIKSEAVQKSANNLAGLSTDAMGLLSTYMKVETNKLKNDLEKQLKPEVKPETSK